MPLRDASMALAFIVFDRIKECFELGHNAGHDAVHDQAPTRSGSSMADVPNHQRVGGGS
jgi:hypothetical protein